jgi:hypothetical protein
MEISSATRLSAGVLVPSASGTCTTLIDVSPENEMDEPPSWAGGSVKVGAPASGTAVGGVGAGVAGEPGAPGVGELVGAGMPGRPGIGGVVSLGAGLGDGDGLSHCIRMGMHNAAGTAVCTGAAPIPVTASAIARQSAARPAGRLGRRPSPPVRTAPGERSARRRRRSSRRWGRRPWASTRPPALRRPRLAASR